MVLIISDDALKKQEGDLMALFHDGLVQKITALLGSQQQEAGTVPGQPTHHMPVTGKSTLRLTSKKSM